MGEQAPFGIRDAAFGGADAAAGVQHIAFRRDQAGFRRDGADEGNLEFHTCLADAFIQGRLDGEAHATIQQGCRETAMHGAGRVEMRGVRRDRDGDAAVRRFRDVVAQGFGNCIQRQGAVGEALDEFRGRTWLSAGRR